MVENYSGNLSQQIRQSIIQLEYITSEARADFRFLLPITKDAVVPDVCGGWGKMTTAFARTCKHVFTLDTSQSKLEFVNIRTSQEGLTNITFIQSRPSEIPLPFDSCHIALLTDTLECEYWCSISPLSQNKHSQVLHAIGSGMVESVTKQYKSRFCGPGMRWSRNGAERLLPVRTAIMSSRFDKMWRLAYNSPPI